MNKITLTAFMFFTCVVAGCKQECEGDRIKAERIKNAKFEKGAVHSQAPDFKLASVDGKKIKLSDYKGKIIIIDFWATWCPPCRKGIPDLIEIQKEYGIDLVVIGISVDSETKKEVFPFMQNTGINYPVAFADREVVQSYGGIESIPTSFVIDQKGTIVDKHIGLVRKSEFTDVIKKLLGKS